MRQEKRGQQPIDTRRTGVGTPDAHAEVAGMALGGDTGDVGTPRDSIGGTPGGTHGTTAQPEASTVVSPTRKSSPSRRRAA